MKIKVAKNGPYRVTGSVPLREMYIVPKGKGYVLEEGRKLPQAKTYTLCRCGESRRKPFCDGHHVKAEFDGTEVAKQTPYEERVSEIVKGEKLNLLDDGRCAFSRFCHTERGDTWTLARNDCDEESYDLAVKSAGECVSGRLVTMDKDGNAVEETSEPEIIILQDPSKNSSAGIFVKGPITVVAEDGTPYEVRNRVALCRCGKSSNKPFCDATHIRARFRDGHEQQD